MLRLVKIIKKEISRDKLAVQPHRSGCRAAALLLCLKKHVCIDELGIGSNVNFPARILFRRHNLPQAAPGYFSATFQLTKFHSGGLISAAALSQSSPVFLPPPSSMIPTTCSGNDPAKEPAAKTSFNRNFNCRTRELFRTQGRGALSLAGTSGGSQLPC